MPADMISAYVPQREQQQSDNAPAAGGECGQVQDACKTDVQDELLSPIASSDSCKPPSASACQKLQEHRSSDAFSTAESGKGSFYAESALLSAEPMAMGMQRRTGSPGSEGSTSTAMHPHSGQHMPISSLHGAAADWTPKKGGGAASLAESSASPVSVIPKNTRRRPNLAQDAARASPADRHGSTQSGDRRANGSHIGSRMMGSLYGSTPQHSAAGVLHCGAVYNCNITPSSHLAMT